MPAASNCSAIELLRDGRRIEIRALRPDDRTDLLAALGRIGSQSLRRRFFGLKRFFSEPEIAYFVNVDFVDHVALVAVAEELGRPVIVGGGRYIVAMLKVFEKSGFPLHTERSAGEVQIALRLS